MPQIEQLTGNNKTATDIAILLLKTLPSCDRTVHLLFIVNSKSQVKIHWETIKTTTDRPHNEDPPQKGVKVLPKVTAMTWATAKARA